MARHLWPGDVLLLDDEAFGLLPGRYVVSDFPPGEVELRALWRNEDNLLSPTSTVLWLTETEVSHPLFQPLRRHLFCERD